jgi:hypothetical protein
VNIQNKAPQDEACFLGETHHSILEDAECSFPGHLIAEASVHPGCESHQTHDNAESLILELLIMLIKLQRLNSTKLYSDFE